MPIDSLDDRMKGEAAARKRTAKADAEVERTVYRNLMSSAPGRRFIWLRLSEARCFELTFVAGAADATAFNEGQRSAGNRMLVAVMAAAPNDFVKMLQENSSVKLEEEEIEDE